MNTHTKSKCASVRGNTDHLDGLVLTKILPIQKHKPGREKMRFNMIMSNDKRDTVGGAVTNESLPVFGQFSVLEVSFKSKTMSLHINVITSVAVFIVNHFI